MYQSILPVLSQQIAAGKSGVVRVIYKYNDHAEFYLLDGVIQQVKTSALDGKKAVTECGQWVSVEVSFDNNEAEPYTVDSTIDTQKILEHYEKSNLFINAIKKIIPNPNVFFAFDSSKLSNDANLKGGDLKVALCFNGKRDVDEAFRHYGKAEIDFLAHTCRLIKVGVLSEETSQEVSPVESDNKLILALEEKIVDLVGPAGLMLLEDSLKAINVRSDMLTKRKIPLLLRELGNNLDDSDRLALNSWSAKLL